MSLPLRNTDKNLGNTLLAPSVVSIFDVIEDAEEAVRALDEASFGDELVYGRGERAREGVAARKQGIVAHLYRAMQAVMSDEYASIKLYEQKIDAGSSFILVPLANSGDVDQTVNQAVDRVATILKAHHVTLAHFLGRTGFRPL